ncbi:hypothetical protein AZE42_09494 [Rhizopogon vesiculosus]|uniref:Uncharacterized protein n=1 Tax=Rhizopogon vesiculosus TaxID=180088 RepID=A0A1J8Q0U7_9AGAM|nr:hypothetical protein AZE42_09494 [Rhizopogon vesiculosus]
MMPPWFSRMRCIHTSLVRVIPHRRSLYQTCRVNGFELGEGVRHGVTIWMSAGDDKSGTWSRDAPKPYYGDLKTVSSETAQWLALCSEQATMAILSEEKLENESIPSSERAGVSSRLKGRISEPVPLMGHRGKYQVDVAEKIKFIQGDDNTEREKTDGYM